MWATEALHHKQNYAPPPPQVALLLAEAVLVATAKLMPTLRFHPSAKPSVEEEWAVSMPALASEVAAARATAAAIPLLLVVAARALVATLQ